MPITYLDKEEELPKKSKITYLDEQSIEAPITSNLFNIPGGANPLSPLNLPKPITEHPVISGALGLAGYGLAKPVKLGASAIKSSFTKLPAGKQEQFAEKIQNEFVQQHTNKVKEFGNKLDELTKKNPNAKVDLSNLIREINSDPDILSEARNVFNKTKLKEMFTRPDLAENVTLREAQDIINHLNKKVSPMNKYYITEAINDIRGAQLESFPEMSKVRQSYKEFINPYKNVKKYFGFNKTIPSIENRFGGAQGQMAVKRIMPPKIYEEMLAFRRAPSVERIAGKIGKTVGFGGKLLGMIPSVTSVLPAAEIALGSETKGLSTPQKLGLMGAQAMGQDTDIILKTKSALQKLQSGQEITPEEKDILIKARLIA